MFVSSLRKVSPSELMKLKKMNLEWNFDNMPGKNTSEFRSNSEPNSISLVDAPPQAHHSDSGQIKSPTYDIKIHNTGTLSSNKPQGRYSTGGRSSRV
ncbi:hypothetical protein TNIN_59471 [Trichonephila inaurata madagascariensis]|uniref:Uncharacterized protein n=1 Tax=Trichonephila inaurata madagascariensis TaxID=2747483 RepID=A0A8X6WPF2_9ARAC|nr:hypothetical protein TNIN_59471 [Trichonephila inaurata madagascariensis]